MNPVIFPFAPAHLEKNALFTLPVASPLFGDQFRQNVKVFVQAVSLSQG